MVIEYYNDWLPIFAVSSAVPSTIARILSRGKSHRTSTRDLRSLLVLVIKADQLKFSQSCKFRRVYDFLPTTRLQKSAEEEQAYLTSTFGTLVLR